MKTSLTSAKISRPGSFGIFPRERLFRLLDHRHDQPILWITGPPGSGKTTLITSWLEARSLNSLWYQVDEGDSDPAGFFYYLGMAVRRANSRRRKPLPLFTPEYFLGIPTFSRRFFENAYDRLIPVCGGASPFVMVFDNCQEVPEGAAFGEIINAGVEHVPRGMKLIFISRRDPSGAFVRLTANSLMKTIGWDELRFTLDESKQMLSFRGFEAVPSEAVGRLHERTDGWAAGMVLFLERARNGGIEPVLCSKACASGTIFQYLAGEIFEKAEPTVRDFLLKTSVFPLMSPRMTEVLTGNRQAKRILSDLTSRNYFTQKLESDTPHYRYHPLFREFLQYLALEAMDAAGLAEIERRAAAILEEDGRPEDAVELFKKAGAWPDAVRLILTHAPDLAGQSRSGTLEAWIEGIPAEVVRETPWLLYWKGVCRLPSSPSESHTLFDVAFTLFRKARDPVGVFASLSGLFDSIAWSFGAYERFDAALALLDEALNEFPGFPSVEIEGRLTASRLFAIVFRQPWHSELGKTADRALSILPLIGDVNTKMLVLRCLLLHSVYFGEPQKAETFFDLCRGLSRTPDISPLVLLSIRNDEANYYRSIAESQKGRKSVKEAMELASSTGVHLMDAFLLGQGVVAALDLGYMEEADSLLGEMAVSLDRMPPWPRNLYYHLRAWKSLVQGDFTNAVSHAEMAVKIILEAGIPHSIAHSRFVYALALAAVKRSREARCHLAWCRDFARISGSLIMQFACLLAEAGLAFDSGDDSSGLRLLKKALAIGRRKGYLNTPYSWTPAMMASLCRRALEAGIEVDYVQRLIRKRNLIPNPPPIECEQWPWVLKIHTLGRFEIIRAGQPVQFSGKVQKMPLELLKILVSSGGGELSEEYIADFLWQDADGDRAYGALKMTVSRLRRFLGVEGSVRFQDGRLSLDPRWCWVDAYAFERIAAHFEGAFKESAACLHAEDSRTLRLAERAVSLYKGHLLPGSGGKSWTIPYRERLRTRFAHLITRTGGLLERKGQYERALEFYQKGIEIDDLCEEFHQRLMICFRQLGRRADAMVAYNHCRKMFLAKLGIEPSPQTKEILKTL